MLKGRDFFRSVVKKLFTTIVSAFVLGGAPFALGTEAIIDMPAADLPQFDNGSMVFDDINSNAFMDLNNLDFYNYDFINLNLDDYLKTFDFSNYDFGSFNLDDYLKTFDFSNYDFGNFNLDDSYFSNQVYTGVNFENSYDSNLSNISSTLVSDSTMNRDNTSGSKVSYSTMNRDNTSGFNLSDISSTLVSDSTINSDNTSGSKVSDSTINSDNTSGSNLSDISSTLVSDSTINSDNTSGSNLNLNLDDYWKTLGISDNSSALVPYSSMDSGNSSSGIVDNPSVSEPGEAVYSCTPGRHSTNELDKEWLEKNIPNGIKNQGCINYKDSYAQRSQIQTIDDLTYKASRVADTLHVEGDTQYVVSSKSIGFEYDDGTNLGCVALKVTDNHGNVHSYDLSKYNHLNDYDWQTKMNDISYSIGAMPLFDSPCTWRYDIHAKTLRRGRTVNFVKRSAFDLSKTLQDYLKEGAVL